MSKILIICFVLFTMTFIGCHKDEQKHCTANHSWNEVTKKCEPKPVEAALLTQEQCQNDLTKIWDTENNKCRDRLEAECNADGTKWENDQCVKIVISTGTGPDTTDGTDSTELYTITNNSSIAITVSALYDPASFPENSDHIPPNLLAYIGLRTGECVNVTKEQFTSSLKIKRNFSAISCDNFHKSTTKCNDGTPAHLDINNHPTIDGRRYEWIEIVIATAETHNESCPLLEKRN